MFLNWFDSDKSILFLNSLPLRFAVFFSSCLIASTLACSPHFGTGCSYLHFGQICFAGLSKTQRNIIPATRNRGQKRNETRKTARKSNQRPQPDPLILDLPSYPQFGQLICLARNANAIFSLQFRPSEGKCNCCQTPNIDTVTAIKEAPL